MQSRCHLFKVVLVLFFIRQGDQGFPGEVGATGERGAGEPGGKVIQRSVKLVDHSNNFAFRFSLQGSIVCQNSAWEAGVG